MLDTDPFVYFSDLLVLMAVVVPIYYLVPWAWARQLVLGLTGSYLTFLIAPRLLLFFVIFWLLVYGLQHAATLFRDRRASWVWTTLLIGLALTPMLAWKLFPEWAVPDFNERFHELVTWLNPWTGAIDRVRSLILPIGLSFATFRAIDQLIKVRLEIVEPLSPLRQFAFAFFPSVLVIGPVIEYTEIEEGLTRRTRWDPQDTLSGLLTIALGAVKVFGAAYLLRGSQGVFALETRDGSPLEYWLELAMYAWYFFFNFSGFSDMAIGCARIFGYRLAPNFNNPYLKTNPQDFWNSWHMSLTRFAQRNVFVPMGGMRARTQYVAIAATMMVIALWHDVSVPLVIFGVYHSVGLIAHRRWVASRPVSADRSLARRVGANVVFFGYFLLSLPLLSLELATLPDFYGRLFS
ncbi:MBOAT family O-acyltransferase [Nocardioides jensenii]|uniref:MBOAT family O-acyltransferase n=1 Tax=Nocardioides jensenii TaxID=1843 RepID=UPI00083781EE|nr:MBOAT family O-acyltransferase [Nocardioides jensenii]